MAAVLGSGKVMSNGMNELFTAALGLSSPWQVSEVRFEQAAHEIHFDVRCEARRLPCPRCGAADQPIHDRQARVWQHLHFFQFRAFVHAEVPRVRCAVCGERGEPEVHQVLVPWARARSGFTLLMEALVVTLVRMSGMPVRQVAALLGVTDQRLWRSLEALVDAARETVSMAAVTAIGIDEKHVGRIGVVSVVHDVGSGAVLHVSRGAKAANLNAFVADLTAHGGSPERIETVTLDMARAYIAGVASHLPNAATCFDPFHLVQLANEAMDQVRRHEVAERPELKGTRYHWLKDASDWTRAELDLHWLRMTRCQTTRAWQMKEAFRELLRLRRQPNAPVILLFDRWISWARRSRLAPFKRLAKTFAHHRAGIERMLAGAHSNARAESINATIQAQISRARGFRTLAKLRTIVYLTLGGLRLPNCPFRPVPAPA
jgi:transposase